MALEMNGQDLYLRHTNTDGKTHVTQHRVWDAPRFLSAQQDAARNVNADATASGKPAKAKVDQITNDQYRKEKA